MANDVLIAAARPVASAATVERLKDYGIPESASSRLPRPIAYALLCHREAPQFLSERGLALPIATFGFDDAMPQTRQDLEAALAVAQDGLERGGPADCLMAMSTMRACTRQRQTLLIDEQLMLATYAEKFAKYPAHVVARACDKWMETSPFWPAISELLPYCDWALQTSSALVFALKKALGHFERGPSNA